LLALYSMPFAWGFLNFQFGLGIALWGLAVMTHLRDRACATQLAAQTVIVAILSISHVFALGLYAWTLGLSALSRFNRVPHRRVLWGVAITIAPIGVMLAGVLGMRGLVGHGTTVWDPASKLRSVFTC